MEKVIIPRMILQPHFPNQSDQDNFIRDIGLIKISAELLISILKEKNLLGKD